MFKIIFVLVFGLLVVGCEISSDDVNGMEQDKDSYAAGDSNTSKPKCLTSEFEKDGICLPRKVNIYVDSVVIGPGKMDGNQWDSTGFSFAPVPSSVITGLSTALGVPGAGSILEFMAQNADVKSLEKPDPYGAAYLGLNGKYDDELGLGFAAEQDTFFVTLGVGFGWEDVDLEDEPRVKIMLLDEDLMNDDSIGSPVVTSDDILEALDDGEVFYVRVENQTQNQVLLIGIEVTR